MQGFQLQSDLRIARPHLQADERSAENGRSDALARFVYFDQRDRADRFGRRKYFLLSCAPPLNYHMFGSLSGPTPLHRYVRGVRSSVECRWRKSIVHEIQTSFGRSLGASFVLGAFVSVSLCGLGAECCGRDQRMHNKRPAGSPAPQALSHLSSCQPKVAPLNKSPAQHAINISIGLVKWPTLAQLHF